MVLDLVDRLDLLSSIHVLEPHVTLFDVFADERFDLLALVLVERVGPMYVFGLWLGELSDPAGKTVHHGAVDDIELL